MQFPEEFAWACACIAGMPHPFIHENSIRSSRADAQSCLGRAWMREGETLRQGWKRAYRNGWRCIRVRVSPAFQEPHHAE